ncbi:hypothetical protein [Halomarina ordinaria]|uniref:HTH domain-containing protein n=1 Tax=Halomarina ordinaria TaxID=3033939 RepID=A0ABD5U8W4_9EURY|nr:hypothetical protein [Halomarina sp. PSRA2]
MTSGSDRVPRQFRKFSAEEALEIFESREDNARPVTADDVTEVLGWSRRTVHNKLKELVEKDKLATRKVGARARVWWIPQLEESQEQDTSISSAPPGAPKPRQKETATSTGPETAEEVLEIIRDDLSARNEEQRMERSRAILSAYKYLQEHGEGDIKAAEIDDIKEHAYSKYPTERDADRQWDNYLREGLILLPGVEPSPGTSGIWYFIEPGNKVIEKIDSVGIASEIEEIEVKGDGEVAKRQRALLQLAYDYLKDRGSATKEDFERILPEYHAHYANFDVLWSYFLRDSLKRLDGVIAPPQGTGTWQYISPNLRQELNVEIEEPVRQYNKIKGEGEVADRQRQLLQLAYNHLKSEGSAKRSDFEEVLPDYTAHYSDFEGLWSYLLREGLESIPNVSKEASRGRYTTYRHGEPQDS